MTCLGGSGADRQRDVDGLNRGDGFNRHEPVVDAVTVTTVTNTLFVRL